MLSAARGQSGEAMVEMRPKMEQLRKEAGEELEALLTEEQVPEYRMIRGEALSSARTACDKGNPADRRADTQDR